MMSAPQTGVTYVFHLADGREERVGLTFSAESHLLEIDRDEEPEDWTRLGFQICSHCPLDVAVHPRCPFAAGLQGVVRRFEAFYSYEMTVVEVVTDQRTVVANRSLQEAIASIVGLIGATSGCPHLAFFRPMARFHLPFATEQETLVRAFSMHLLAEYLRQGGEGSATLSFDGLEASYHAVAEVNQGMAERIRGAFTKDAAVNAIIILDTFVQAVPFVVHEAMRELRPLFVITPEQ